MTSHRLVPLLALLGLLLTGSLIPAHAAAPVTAILGITSETKVLLTRMTNTHETRLFGIAFVSGQLHGAPIVLGRCGVGKVNAAMAATLLISQFHPGALLFSGSAGALNSDLIPGDVVIGAKTVQHDAGTVTDKGMQHEPIYGAGYRFPLFFPANPAMLKVAQQAAALPLQSVDVGQGGRLPKIVTGTIATGDVFVANQALNDDLRHNLGADAVEEEGAAVAQVCWQAHVPYLAIRSMSDNANGQTPVNYAKFYGLASENSARLVTEIVVRLSKLEAAGKLQ